MTTKSRQRIYGRVDPASAQRAKEARKKADRLAMRGLEHAAARLHWVGADAKLFGLQYTRTTSFSHFWRHCDYADSIAAIATAGARFESMGAVMRNRPPLAAPLLMMLIVTVAVLWRALYAVASVIVDHYGLLGTLVACGACYVISVIIDRRSQPR